MKKPIICSECGVVTLNYNSHFKLCYKCNNIRLKANKKDSVPTGERDMFLEIWDEREHYCDNCRMYLGSVPKAHYFAHIKPKSTHPKLRLDKNNIKLLCYDCHYALDMRGNKAFKERNKL